MRSELKRCPECAAAGQSSRVDVGTSISTSLAGVRFYDEEGRYHHHDPNLTTTSYHCSHGHEWTQVQPHRCWCGWPAKEVKP